MKKIYHCLLTILLFLFFYDSSYGQVSFGVKSGMNIATTKDLLAFPKNRIGWYGGGFASMEISKNFFLMAEILYSSKGDGSYNDIGGLTSTRRFNYLNFPIFFGYRIDRRTAVILGPEFGYLLSAHLISDGENFDISRNYPPKFDVGLDVGIMYNLIKSFRIELHYIYGFNTLYSVDAVGVRNSETNGANRVFQIGFAYSFLK